MRNDSDELLCWVVIILLAFIFAKWYIEIINLLVNYFLGVN